MCRPECSDIISLARTVIIKIEIVNNSILTKIFNCFNSLILKILWAICTLGDFYILKILCVVNIRNLKNGLVDKMKSSRRF